MTWPSAGQAPHNNVVGIDPQLRDPEHGDFRPAPGSPAIGYGCQTFPAEPRPTALLAWDADGQVQPSEKSGSRRLDVSGDITSDTVWGADTVRVVGEVTVLGGVTLGIASGVRVVFGDYFALTIAGRLLAIGTPEAPIRFDSANPDVWAPDSTTAGSWGGIRFDGTSESLGPSRLEWCELTHAKGVGARRKGGALSLIDCSGLRVRNCVFTANAAEYGAVLFCEHMANPVVSGSLLQGNSAFTAGSAVYGIDSYPRLFENTIVSNACLNAEYMYDTGVIHNHLSKAWVAGNIVYGNTSSYFIPLQIREAKPFCVRHSDVQYGIDGEGDFDADPLFTGSGPHPFRLSAGSPCRNAGPTDTTGIRLLGLDLAAVPRTMEGRLDVGAYESGDPAEVREPADEPSIQSNSRVVLALASGPNPGGGPVSIRLAAMRPARVLLTIHDAAGRQKIQLLHEELPAGVRTIRWDGRDSMGNRVGPGVYFVRAAADGRAAATLRLVLTP